MASWTWLPYELKLRIGEHLVDSVIAQTTRSPQMPRAIPEPSPYRGFRMVYAEELLQPLVILAPELQKELATYCRKLSTRTEHRIQSSELSFEETVVAQSKAFVARCLVFYLDATTLWSIFDYETWWRS